jgi:hypothetical protein
MEIGSMGTNKYSSSYTAYTKTGNSIQNSQGVQIPANKEKNEKQTDTKINAIYDDNIIYSQGEVDIAKERLYNRTKVTEALNDLFYENGIEIPRENTLTFSITPYDYQLKVSGLKDEALTSHIESILNSGDNAKNLFAHIYLSGNGSDYVKSEQLSSDKCQKLSLFLEIKNNTGYDLRNCISKDGTFYAPDGTDVIKAYQNSTKIPKEYRSEAISTYVPRLRELARKGFNSTGDLELKIEYKDGDLYDIGQKNGYGPGQTKWIDQLTSQYGSDIFIKPEKKLNLDSGNPVISDFLKQNGIKLPEEHTLKFSYIADRNYLSIAGTDDIGLLSGMQFLFAQPNAVSMLQYLSRLQPRASFDASI